jgi:hypothetical protein
MEVAVIHGSGMGNNESGRSMIDRGSRLPKEEACMTSQLGVINIKSTAKTALIRPRYKSSQ